jgi:hypothetical protein
MSSPILPPQFFTIQSMLTLGGATTATSLVCNSLQHAFNFNPKWLALIIAQAFSLYGTSLHANTPSDYFVGLINGFLIYSSAVGITQISGVRAASDANPMDVGKRPNAAARRTFRSAWF